MRVFPFYRRLARSLDSPYASLVHPVETLLGISTAPILKGKRRIAARRPREFHRQFSAQVARDEGRLVSLALLSPCKHAHLREVARLAFRSSRADHKILRPFTAR